VAHHGPLVTLGPDARARSAELFETAQRVIPGGVNSPVRAFRGVGGTPPFIARGAGPLLWDADGNEYVDYVMSWGALALGHAHPAVVEAISRQAALGTSYGAPTALETKLADLIVSAMPSIEMIRFVSSGTEAVMSAIRVARAATGRQLVVKFDGCYHGHADPMLVAAGSGVATLGQADSAGVPPAAVSATTSLPYNDEGAARAFFADRGAEVAAVVVEPIAGNMGLVLPAPAFLHALRELTASAGALLIFDEVMTGFRVAKGGAQSVYGVVPDLTCLGKVIGGGLPAAAYGGRADLMREVAPLGPVYQAGTLSGNPLAMAAGAATLRLLFVDGAYDELALRSRQVAQGLQEAAIACDVAVQTAVAGGMWGFFFNDSPVVDYSTAKQSDADQFRRFFHACLSRGVYLPPSAYEACFMSLEHDAESLARTIDVFRTALR
jgi:glutamate-1-semialdehyde 2,1-aminomutase